MHAGLFVKRVQTLCCLALRQAAVGIAQSLPDAKPTDPRQEYREHITFWLQRCHVDDNSLSNKQQELMRYEESMRHFVRYLHLYEGTTGDEEADRLRQIVHVADRAQGRASTPSLAELGNESEDSEWITPERRSQRGANRQLQRTVEEAQQTIEATMSLIQTLCGR
jgi:hypothetical protein